jgi:hypothetical protein
MWFESLPATRAATIHLIPKAAPTVGIRTQLGVPADLPGNPPLFPGRVGAAFSRGLGDIRAAGGGPDA